MKRNTDLFRAFYSAFDVLIIFFSYYFSEWLWMTYFADSGNFLMKENMRGYVLCAVLTYSIVILLINRVTNIYKSFRYKSIWRIWIKNVFIHAVMIGVLMMGLYLFRIQDVSRGSLLFFFLTLAVTMLIKHLVAIGCLRMIRVDGHNQKHVILVGCGELAQSYMKAVADNRRYGITVDGFVSNAVPEHDFSGMRYFGEYEALNELLKGDGVDEVVIALEEPRAGEVFSVINICEKCGTRVCVIPYYNSMISSVPSLHVVGGLKCFELRTSPLDNTANRTIKRTIDIVFSIFALLISSPILFLTAIGVRLSSPGPIFFRQERVGMDKKTFTMYKFRSMRVNTTSDTAWSSDVDPRRTRFGTFIRKTSIDELPQFFNVLKGDMSVVGPRPEIPHYVEQFRETIPKYMLKHLVRPGITGWAQVNGLRGDTSIEERIKHDIWYIENWTLGLDIKILFRTVFGGMINSEKTK